MGIGHPSLIAKSRADAEALHEILHRYLVFPEISVGKAAMMRVNIRAASISLHLSTDFPRPAPTNSLRHRGGTMVPRLRIAITKQSGAIMSELRVRNFRYTDLDAILH